MKTASPLNGDPTVSRSKPRLLVVDDEPDNLDLLYRTFRRDYRVLKAENGREALKVLEDGGEVAVIISDQRMPEMTGTEFLSRTVPQFPDTVRIILTGFTDVDDLVRAINDGQVYRYVTKPWAPETLKEIVNQAAHTYELLKQTNYSLQVAQQQIELMDRVAHVGQLDLNELAGLQFIVDGWGQTLSTQLCAIQCLNGPTAVYGDLGSQNLRDNALIQTAIATQTCQTLTHDSDGLATAGNLAMPIAFQGQILAVASFQWAQPCDSLDDVCTMLTVPIQQVAQALIALQAPVKIADGRTTAAV